MDDAADKGRPWSRVLNHAALPGQIHIARLVYGPQLNVSNSAG